MRNRDKHIEDLVNETLKAFDGAERARPKPFLHARIKARMERESLSSVGLVVFSPVLQRVILGFVILVLVFNIYTTTRLFTRQAETDTAQMDEQTFVEEMYPSMPTLYSINQTTTNP